MSDIDNYLKNVEEPFKSCLQGLRKTVKELVPEAEESISYQLPTFKLNGKPLIYFGAFKNHMSIFPTSGPIKELEQDLKDFQTAKGTIHFTADKSVPNEIIKKLIEARVKQIQQK